MTTALEHPLSRAIHDAALGQFPDAGHTPVEVGGPLTGPCDAVAFFSDHIVVAADVDPDWVAEKYQHTLDRDPYDLSGRLGAFLAELTHRLGDPPTMANVLAVAPYRPARFSGTLEPGGEVDGEWMAYHSDVRAFGYRSPAVEGTIAIGRGPGERWDVQPFITHEQGQRGNAIRQLLTAAKTLVPDRGPLFGVAPLHHLERLRRALHSGFEPICTELLFLTRPDRASRTRADVPPTRPESTEKWRR